MSTYRFLEDHYIGGIYYLAGTTAVTADIFQGTLPSGWVPTGNVDPQDAAAATAFWNAGVQFPGIVRTQFQPLPVNAPITFWQVNNPGFQLTDDSGTFFLTNDTGALILTTENWTPNAYVLTGLGAGLGPKYLI